MSNTLGHLMERNLREVFGQRDSERRKVAINQLYTEDCIFFEAEEQIVGRDALNEKVERILQEAPGLVFRAAGPAQVIHDLGRLQWHFGPAEAAPKTQPKSERPQVRHRPRSPCNKESQGAFGPVEMPFWTSDHVRNPNQYAKECQHERHQTHRQPCLAIDENGNRGDSKRDRCDYGPEHLVGRNPLWDQLSCVPK